LSDDVGDCTSDVRLMEFSMQCTFSTCSATFTEGLTVVVE